MKYLDFGCNIKCWECSQECSIKDVMHCSIWLLDVPEYELGFEFQKNEFWLNFENVEKFFNYFIMEILKPMAGMVIGRGVNPSIIQEELKETAVAFYVARLRMIETQEKEE